MEQHALKIVNNYLNTNTYSYLETSDGQSFNLCLNVVHLFNTSVNYTFVQHQLKTCVFLHWCLIHVVLLNKDATYCITGIADSWSKAFTCSLIPYYEVLLEVFLIFRTIDFNATTNYSISWPTARHLEPVL